mgnify:CR=1 FL=1
MVQLPQENSIFTRTVRRAAGEDRLSHAVILTGRGDLTAAARFLAAAHVCEGTDRPCLRCRHCRKVLEGKGRISHEAAVKKAGTIYEEFRKKQDADYISEFDRQIAAYLKGDKL